MVRFIHKVTGSEMLVSEEHAEEYRAAGHKPVKDPDPAKGPVKRSRKSRKQG